MFLLFQKLNILLVLLVYIAPTAIAHQQPIAEHTFDIHIPIAIPLDNLAFRQTPTIQASPITSSSVNNIYDQFTASSDFNYYKTGKKHNHDHSQNHINGQNQLNTSKKGGAEYLDKGKLYFRKIKKNSDGSLDLKKSNKVHSDKDKQQHSEHERRKHPTYEVYESERIDDGDLSHNKDVKGQTSREILKTIVNGTENSTVRSKNKSGDKEHVRNIINVLRTRKVRKYHISGENNNITEPLDNFTYPKISPVYIPNDDNNTKTNNTNGDDPKKKSLGKDNSTVVDSKLTFPVTTANYNELRYGNYSLPAPELAPTVSSPRHFKAESRSRRKQNPTVERSKKKVDTSSSTTTGLKERSSDSIIERYEPIVFRYEDYPFQAKNLSRSNNYSNLVNFHNSYVKNLQNRRQQEYENLLANDGNQQGDGKTKKHGKRGFKIISDLVNLITGNNGPPPRRYRGHIIGSDGYAFENNPFANSQSLSLASQGLSLKDNGLSFTNGNNHNFGLTAFGSSKDLGQSFSFGSDGANGHSLSLVHGNNGFGTTGVGSDAQKISFGTSANGDTFSFSNLKDPKSQVESVFSGNSQSGVHTGASENIRIVTKEVPVPYPVHIEKKVPYFIRVPHDRAVPYPVHKPYPVHITKPVPYPVKVHVPAPYPVTVEKHIPFPVKVSVPRPVAIHIPKPYPVYIEKKVPYTVDRPVPYAVKVPYEKPVPVPITVEKHVPYAVTKHVPFPVKIPVEKPFPLSIPKPYPITIEKPVKVPYKVPVPISINFPNKNEQFTTGVNPNTNTGNPTGFGTNGGGSADFSNAGATAFGGNLGDNNQEHFTNPNNVQQSNFPQQFYSQENTNSGNPGYDVNSDGSFDYGDPSNVGFNNAENVQNGFGNTAGGFDTANNFGNNQGSVQADIPNINTVKVPEVNQNYQIYFDGTRQHKHKQTQDIFNEVNTVFDNLENKAVIPNFDQVGHIQHGRQNNAARTLKTPGFRGTAKFGEAQTQRSPVEVHKFPSNVELSQNQFGNPPTQNQYNSNESGHYNSAEANVRKSQFPGSQEYNKIDYTLLGASFESHQSESENHSSS